MKSVKHWNFYGLHTMISYAPISVISPLHCEQEQTPVPQDDSFLSVTDEDREQREVNFTQSMVYPSPQRLETSGDFLQSVHLIESLGGGYQVYSAPSERSLRTNYVSAIERNLSSSRNFGHNISNPDLWTDRFSRKEVMSFSNRNNSHGSMTSSRSGVKFNEVNSVTDTSDDASAIKGTKTQPKSVMKKKKKNGEIENYCACGKYHCHTFSERNRHTSFQQHRMFEMSIPNRGADINSLNENHMAIANTFWKPYLSCCEYKHGDGLVRFGDLWPKESMIRAYLKEGVQNTELRNVIPELCLLSLACGPLRLLKGLLDLALIRVDYQFDHVECGLLHVSCLAQNSEAVTYLTQMGVSNKIKDRNGMTADQVCFCPRMKKNLPAKYLMGRDVKVQALRPSLQDKDSIFRLASNPKAFYDVQKKLQMFNFNVNTELNGEGDFLVHVATRAGLCQLQLIMALVKLQGADIELCNSKGLTGLMIAAGDGDTNLCDILMCLFGANPNKQNVHSGKTAMHYAVEGNHVNTVSCLIKRGGDVNLEDHDGCLPDDLPVCALKLEDCREVIQVERSMRYNRLAGMAKQDILYPIDLRESDLHVTDEDGFTLLMVAAKSGREVNVETLLSVCKSTINAQHGKTGLTALAMAAIDGHADCIRALLRHSAAVIIPDMKGYLPLHHAIMNNNEDAVDAFLEFFPAAYTHLLAAKRLSKKSSIHEKIEKAWERRQGEIVTPELRVCALEGNAEKLYNLLEEGDNVNSKSDLSGWPSLFLGVEYGHLGVVQILKEKGADLKRRHLPTGSTVLHVVAQTSHLNIARYLVQFCHENRQACTRGTCRHSSQKHRHGLDINAVNVENKTALQIAAEKGNIKLVTLFLDNGATTALLNSAGVLFTSPEYEGVRIKIETQRGEHTKRVMKYIRDKSKKAVEMLERVWVPRFDHNLRDRDGDTPLMVACRTGRMEIVQFLLESAVYAQHYSGKDDGSDSNSDADSGVPDIAPPASSEQRYSMSYQRISPSYQEELSLERSQDLTGAEGLGDIGASIDTSTCTYRPDLTNTVNTINQRDNISITEQVNRVIVSTPKGLYIYHDSIVSHVCAVNLFDGCTPLHRAIEGGDNPGIVMALVQTDNTCINMQSDAGLTAVHLACQLGRKKVLEQLLTLNGIDIGLFTLNGHLPEEMTTNKSIIKMVQKARKGQPVRPRGSAQRDASISSVTLTGSIASTESTARGSIISFGEVMEKFLSIKKDMKQDEKENK